MRVERPSLLCRWFNRVVPPVAPREAVAPGRCCFAVRDPKLVEAPPFAYWAYHERQNTMDANIEPGLPRGPGRFTPVQPCENTQPLTYCKPGTSKASVGLGGPSLGYVAPPREDQVPPQRAPQRTIRINDPSVRGSAMDIIA